MNEQEIRADLTREDVVTIAQAVREFRSDMGHFDVNERDARRIEAVLAAAGDEFALVPVSAFHAASDALRWIGENYPAAIEAMPTRLFAPLRPTPQNPPTPDD